MFAATNVFHFFTNELAGLCARRLAFALVFCGSLQGRLLGHTILLTKSDAWRLVGDGISV